MPTLKKTPLSPGGILRKYLDDILAKLDNIGTGGMQAHELLNGFHLLDGAVLTLANLKSKLAIAIGDVAELAATLGSFSDNLNNHFHPITAISKGTMPEGFIKAIGISTSAKMTSVNTIPVANGGTGVGTLPSAGLVTTPGGTGALSSVGGTGVVKLAAGVVSVAPIQQLVVVAKNGGDFQTITAAINSITDASALKPYLVYVAPGVYTEQVTMKPYVSIQGAGQDVTIISWTGGNAAPSTNNTSATIVCKSNSNISFLTSRSVTTLAYATGINGLGTTNVQISNTKSVASGASIQSNGAQFADGSVVSIQDCSFLATGGTGISVGLAVNRANTTVTTNTSSLDGADYGYGYSNQIGNTNITLSRISGARLNDAGVVKLWGCYDASYATIANQ